MTPLARLEGHTDTTFLAECWNNPRLRDLALDIADRSRAEYEASRPALAEFEMEMKNNG